MTDGAETYELARDDKNRIAREAARLCADEFAHDIRAVVAAAEGRTVKSMSDFGLLTDEENILVITLAEEAGVARVKNSGGTGPRGLLPRRRTFGLSGNI